MPTRGFDIIKTETSATEPVSLDMLKTYVQVRSVGHDSVLESLLRAARIHIEGFLCISLVPTDIVVRWEEMDCTYGAEELPYGPVNEISSVADDEAAAVDYKREGLMGSFVSINVTRTEPTVISYKAGYADDKVPEDIKLAIMKHALDSFEQRPGVSFEVVQKLPNDWKATCRRYRRIPWTA